MVQYCRYCSHMYCGDSNYCEVNECCFSDSVIKHTNKCRCFDFLPIDALGENERGYMPRKGHYIVVRCKDCKYCSVDFVGDYQCDSHKMEVIEEDDYCSYGEREEQEHE